MLLVLLAGWVGPERARAGVFCDLLNLQVLEQSTSRTVVRLTWGDDDRLPTAARFVLALPDGRPASVQVLSRRVVPVTSPELVPQDRSSPELVRVARPGKFRDQWVSPVAVYPLLRRDGADETAYDRLLEVTLQFSHPPSRPVSSGGRSLAEGVSPVYEGLVVNPDAAAAFRNAEATIAAKRQPIFDLFENSPRWLRIEVQATGLYRIDQSMLAGLGIDAEMIAPESFRLFAAPHPYQPLLPEDPAGSWWPEYGLRERPLRVEAEGPSFSAGEAVLFYATGPEEWADRYDPAAGPLDHLEHEYADRLAYWLTWDEISGPPNTIPGTPMRMEEIGGQPGGPADRVLTDHRERLHVEENATMLYGAVQDNWVWERRIERERPRSFDFELEDFIPDSVATYVSHGVARGLGQGLPTVEIWFNDDPRRTTLTWSFGVQDIFGRAPAVITAPALGVREGSNRLTLENVSETRMVNGVVRSYDVLFDFFDITYRRHLRLRDGALAFVVFEEEVTEAGVWEFEVQGPADVFADPFYVLDTTDPLTPRVVTGAQVQGNDRVRFAVAMTPGVRQHFLVATGAGLRVPDGLELRRPRLLRAEVRGPDDTATGFDMVIFHPAELRSAAERLADFRAGSLPDRPSGARVVAVDLQDVYDQFGHGVKEPAALRNYLKFLYELDRRLEFVVMFGDASRDYRNRARRDESGSEIDRCPTFIQTQWPRVYTSFQAVPYAADDWFCAMDDPPPRTSTENVFIDLPDLAVGRLPAGNLAEANFLVDRIVAYEQPSEPVLGPWRNTVLMVADDEVGLASGDISETEHIEEAECVAEALLPPALEVDKLYLTEFPVIPNTRAKPKARETLRQKWTQGVLVVHYIGHGSPEQLADEAVFRIEDVASLRNEDLLPLFLAFSCDVAIFDDRDAKSMTEQLVLEPAGGAIAGIAATQVTFVTPNENLTETFYPYLYPDSLLDRSAPVGRALMQAKVNTPGNRDDFDQHNNQKYHLLGDPALRLQSPREAIAMSGSLADSIQSGRVQALHARIEDDGGSAMDRGRYFLMARESADSTVYLIVIPRPDPDDPPRIVELPYVLPGATFFDGTGRFEGGELETQLQSPRFLELGEHGRVRVLMGSGSDLLVAADGEVPVRRTSFASDDEEGPQVSLSFENDASQVTPGTTLTAVLEDPSGINVLGTQPSNSILLEQDDSGFPVDVTSLFRLDEGRFTRGQLEYELPQETSPGRHTLVLSVSDMLENASKAEIGFNVIPAGGAQISGHSVFPNPFRDRARFVVEVTSSSSSDVEITIHSTDGRTIQRLRRSGVQGKILLEWDGRDLRGDEVANGVYLYTVRASFQTERAFTEVSTGRVVRMR